jgi:hypothetical protein
VILRGPANEMTRSDLIRAAKRFSAITTDLREPEDPSAAGIAIDSTNWLEEPVTTSAYPAASTWWNSIALFFGRCDCVRVGGDYRWLCRLSGRSEDRHASTCFQHRQTTAAHQCSGWRYEPGQPGPVFQQELSEHFDFAQKGHLL